MPASAKPWTMRRGERADRVRVEVQRAVADHALRAVVEVEHRREAEVDAVRAELGADHVGRRARGLFRRSRSRSHSRPSSRIGGMRGEALAEALHPPAFVVDADRQRRLALALDVLDEAACSCSGFS